MEQFKGWGKPTATDISFFEARLELTHHERCLLTILDWEGEHDLKVLEYQNKCRFYLDEVGKWK